MKVDWFLWDDRTVGHVARHAIRPHEVDETLEGVHRVLKTRNGRYILLGRSSAGRYLAVIFETPIDGSAWVVTARDLTRAERRHYQDLL